MSVKRDYRQQVDEMKKLHDTEVKELSTNRDDFWADLIYEYDYPATV